MSGPDRLEDSLNDAVMRRIEREHAAKPHPTATAAHACSYCRRHPNTHAPTGDDRCGACGLGDTREVAP